jgi:hypothetical protein
VTDQKCELDLNKPIVHHKAPYVDYYAVNKSVISFVGHEVENYEDLWQRTQQMLLDDLLANVVQ